MTITEIKFLLLNPDITSDQIFEVTRAIAYFHSQSDSDEVEVLDLTVRLVEKRDLFESKVRGIGSMIDAVLRETGLFPYVSEAGTWRDQVALNIMRAPRLNGTTFHIEQAAVFNRLAQGRSVVLSAPTSFGKSLLIDALIAFRHMRTIVAVVPTIALLDEFRRRMLNRFVDYQIITRSLEERTAEFAIYIGTQERLLERKDLDDIDLFVIDEFYKLDLDRSDRRSLALNAVLSKYGKRAKQIYLLGPSIDEVPNLTRFRNDLDFIKTRFSPVTADIIDRTKSGSDPDVLLKDLLSVKGSSSLIYTQSPPSASKLAFKLMDQEIAASSSFCDAFGEWLELNFHPEWALAKTIRQGFGIHHGRIPRAIAHMVISLFNKQQIEAIICTSSMIEGVNTAAQNVFIFDRNISTSKLDRFTFDNIKGRAGRMFRHNIGRVYLYNVPPEQEEFSVRIPLFDADEALVPELLMQLDDETLSISARRRKRSIAESSGLPAHILSTWAEFGVDALNTFAVALEDELHKDNSLIYWAGIPTFDNLAQTFLVVWEVLRFPRHDIRSPRQLAFFADRLRKSKSMRAFLDGLTKGEGLQAQPDLDRCFNFMRGCEYTYPQVLRAMNDIIDALIGEGNVNYRYYASQMQNLFLAGELRALDEMGVPIPLVQNLTPYLDPSSVQASLEILTSGRSEARNSLSQFENNLLDIGLAI